MYIYILYDYNLTLKGFLISKIFAVLFAQNTEEYHNIIQVLNMMII